MKLNKKFLPLIVFYTIIVIGFFVYSVYVAQRLKRDTQLLLGSQIKFRNQTSQKFAITPNRDVLSIDSQKEALPQTSTTHIKKPEAVKGIYITAATVTTPKFDKLLDLVDKTELNAIVLDLKDWKQRPAFKMQSPSLREFNISEPIIKDLEALIQKVHNKGIYLIGRITVFQDPYLVTKKSAWALKSKRGGIWRDWKGVSWLDPTNREVWKYNVELAREAYSRGFDEINFDYVRFPSDGPVEDIIYTDYDGKTEKFLAMRKFFGFLDHELRRNGVTPRDGITQKEESVNMPISVDVFGLTMGREDGLGIGQRLQDVAPFFDAVSPMVYPSHYPPRFRDFSNPAAHPYEIISEAMNWGVVKLTEMQASSTPLNSSGRPLAQLRPWLQDFDLGADYNADMVRKEIQAVYAAGLRGWLLWNAGNNYTEDALLRSQ